MATTVTVARLKRARLRLGKTAIASIADGGTVVDLEDAAIARDMVRFQPHWVILDGDTDTP